MKGNQVSNLPDWIGAEGAYKNATEMLKKMGKNGHVSVQKNKWGKVLNCTPSEEMNDLIEALNSGNEEKIKGLVSLYRIYGYDKEIN